MTTAVTSEMKWLDDENLELGGMRFLVTFDPRFFGTQSTQARFLLIKAKYQLEEYLRIGAQERPQRIVELGIWQGGSAVFFERAYAPEKLVALEIGAAVPALDDFVRAHGLEERLKPYYGINQADRSAVTTIINREFPGQQLDLVIDDASHLLHETRTSFNVLFPRVRPGGLYVIEDWGWEHWGGVWQTSKNTFAGTPALTNLIFELCMTVASRPDIVAHAAVLPSMVVVRRGDAMLPSDFDISKSYMVRDPTDFAPLFGGVRKSVVHLARRVRRLAKQRSTSLLQSAVHGIRAR